MSWGERCAVVRVNEQAITGHCRRANIVGLFEGCAGSTGKRGEVMPLASWSCLSPLPAPRHASTPAGSGRSRWMP